MNTCLTRTMGLGMWFAWLTTGLWAHGQEQARSLDSIYPGAAKLRAATRDVVCLVDVEHPDLVREDIRDRAPRFHSLERVRLGIELETAGLPCLLTHASLMSAEDLNRPHVKAVVVCGRKRSLDPEEETRLLALLRERRSPLLAIGGGLGVLVRAWDGKIGSMRRLRPGEEDPLPGYMPGVFKEIGFTQVEIEAHDPLFAGFEESVLVMQHHGSEIKKLPPDFLTLARTAECRAQAVRHRERPIYGVQFLPDRFDELHGDGRQILRNFFELAGIDTERRVAEAQTAYRAWARELVGKVCEEPRRLREQSAPFVAVVNLEGPEVVASDHRGSGSGLTHAEKIAQLRGRIEGELAGLPCVAVHYIEARKEDFSSPHLRAIVITGAGSPTADPMARDLFAVVREAEVPILGICAGHQHIAQAHGVRTSKMRPLREGEKDPHPPYHPGMFKEWGFLPVKVIKQDPLFDGLPETIVVREYHVAEIASLPEDFALLASTEECKVQAMKLVGKPVYGTQFHPENYDDEHPDGRRVLQNFFRIAAGGR